MSRYALRAWAFVMIAVVVSHARSADDAKDEAVKRFKESLQGKWQMTSRVQDGVPSEAELVKNRTVTFEGDKYTVRDGENRWRAELQGRSGEKAGLVRRHAQRCG